MKQYIDELNRIYTEGDVIHNKRTGKDITSVFGSSVFYDISERFPLLTTKLDYFKGAVVELSWLLKGLDNTEYLHQHGVKFWDQWALKGDQLKTCDDVLYAYEHGQIHKINKERMRVIHNDMFMLEERNPESAVEILLDRLYMTEEDGTLKTKYDDRYFLGSRKFKTGDLGPVYGVMLRRFPNPDGTTTDQLKNLINGLLEDPSSRRHVVSLWCPYYLPDSKVSPQQNVRNGKQALAPCHWNWTFNTKDLGDGEYELNLHFGMRSNDYPVGAPVNKSFYALLLMLVAQTVNMKYKMVWHTATDAHIYEDQHEGVETQLSRIPLDDKVYVELDPEATVFNFEPHMVKLVGDYKHQGKIAFEVAL